jgi:hypothetical protein
MTNIIQFPKKPKSAAKSRSRRKSMASSVVAFPRGAKPAYSLDVISERVVDGMVLIEACISVAALTTLMACLNAS